MQKVIRPDVDDMIFGDADDCVYVSER